MQMYVAMFHRVCCYFYYGQSGYILAHISMTTRARDFKFAGAIVQRLYLVMVALLKIGCQRNMVGFVTEGHIYVIFHFYGFRG